MTKINFISTLFHVDNNQVIESFYITPFFIKKNGKNKIIGKINFLIEDEEIYISEMEFPSVADGILYELVKGELFNQLGEKNSIYFDYLIEKNNGKSILLKVYYINLKYLDIIEKYKMRIQKIKLIQLVLLEYYSNQIKNDNFGMTIEVNSTIYILFIVNNILVANIKLANDINKYLLEERIKVFFEKYKRYFESIKIIYMSNKLETLKDYMPNKVSYSFLKDYDKFKFLRYSF